MITLTRRTITQDATTRIASEVVTTITGTAFEKSSGEAEVFERLSLVRAECPLLVFTPTTYGDRARIGDTLQWPENGTTYTVRSARHLEPDAAGPIISWLVVST